MLGGSSHVALLRFVLTHRRKRETPLAEFEEVEKKRTMTKTILVTGASSGFGRRTAETLSKSGHKVFAGFRSLDGAKKQVADELKRMNVELLKLDVTDQ